VGMGEVDCGEQERVVGDALAPEAAPAEGGVGKGDVMGGGELAHGFDVGARIVVDVAFAGEVHPIGAGVVGREDDPFGLDGFEIGFEFCVALGDDFGLGAGVVDEFGDDDVGLEGEDGFLVVFGAAGGLGEVAGGVAAAPGLGEEFDGGFGVLLAQAGDELFLPAIGGFVGEVGGVGDAVAPS